MQQKKSKNKFPSSNNAVNNSNINLIINKKLKEENQVKKINIIEIEEPLKKSILPPQQIRETHKTIKLENNEIEEIKKKLAIANFSFNEVIKELAEQKKITEELHILFQNESKIVNWYKATYEDRTLLGILKEKLLATDIKKGNSKIPDKIVSTAQSPAKSIVKNKRNLSVVNVLEKKINKYHLRPANQIKTTPNTTEYLTTGDDPFFIIEFKEKRLKAGWYWLSIDVTVLKGVLLSPLLYFDYGKGFNEVDVWNLPAINNGKIACLINFSSFVFQLRFDPTTTISIFNIQSFSLKPAGTISVFQIGMSMYKKINKPEENNLSFYAGLTATFLKTGKLNLREKVREAIYFNEKYSWDLYKNWCTLYDTILPIQLKEIQLLSANLSYQPIFSIIMPVYNAPIVFLKKAIESLRNQAYKKWELCIADDKSTNENVRKLLQEYQLKDERIKIVFRKTNGHISKASNSALTLATGDFIVLLDQDDELPVHCLYMVASALNKNKNLGIIYSDEDKIDEKGNRFDPYFKTDWNKELFYGQNMINHLGVYNHSLVKKIGGFREGYEGSQDYDLALRCIEHLKPDQIYHIPHVLYHWRAINGSTAITVSNKSYANTAGLKALQDHFQRTKKLAIPVENVHSSFRIKWTLPKTLPLVSIIIPTKDKVTVLATCINSLLQNTMYSNFEVLIIDNNSEEVVTHDYYKKLQRENKQVKVFAYNAEFNFSAMNNFGAKQSRGEILVLLNNDTEVINDDWLNEMVSHCLRNEVGAVGAKLYYPNGQVQHAGVFLFEGSPGVHIFLNRDKNDSGYFNKLNLVQNYLAVTAACLAVRKEIYIKVGGLDEQNLRVAYNDVDFCLKLVKLGYKNVWTPFAQLKHYESLSRGSDLDEKNLPRFKQEQSYMFKTWGSLIANDPFYNHNLGIDTRRTMQFAFPPKIQYEWQKEFV